MKLSAASHEELESFFREFLRDEGVRVPPFKIHAGRAAGWLTGRAGVEAITLGHHVLVSPRCLKRGGRAEVGVAGRLLAHEAAHVLQAERAGLVPFLFAYLREYFGGLRRAGKLDALAHRKAYSEISFEREARAAERAYVAWRARRERRVRPPRW